MAIVQVPAEYTGDLPSVFLAGGIVDCPDWQAQACQLLASDEWVVLNPRWDEYPTLDPAAAKRQVAWEFRHLAQAPVILFWFPGGPSVQPIAMYELGRYAALGKRMVVGADPQYLRRADVVLQLRHARPDLTVYDDLGEVCRKVRYYLGYLSGADL